MTAMFFPVYLQRDTAVWINMYCESTNLFPLVYVTVIEILHLCCVCQIT